MVVADIGKLVMQVAVLAAITGLAIAGKISDDLVTIGLSSMLGYLYGNGVNAVRKSAPSPVLTTSQDRLSADADAANTPG